MPRYKVTVKIQKREPRHKRNPLLPNHHPWVPVSTEIDAPNYVVAKRLGRQQIWDFHQDGNMLAVDTQAEQI